MEIENSKLLVCGGAGFIGSHLVERLARQEPAKIVVVDNFFLGKMENLAELKRKFSNLAIINHDTSSFKLMKKIIEKHQIETVFNLAVVCLPASLARPSWAYKTNVKIVMTLCELLRRRLFACLVQISSSEAYGSLVRCPMNEEHPLNPTTPYAASKAAGDHLAMSYNRTFGLDVRILRPFNNYGPRQNEGTYSGVIPATIKRILRGEPAVIYGDGKQTRDYTFVSDTADAIVLATQNDKMAGLLLNVASGFETTILDLVTSICQALNYKGKIQFSAERPGDVKRHLGDATLARQLLNYKPRVPLETGIRKTVDWYIKLFRRNSLLLKTNVSTHGLPPTCSLTRTSHRH